MHVRDARLQVRSLSPENEQITPIPFDSFSLTAYSSTFESVSRRGGENSSIAIGPQEASTGGSCQMRRPARRRSHHHPSPHLGINFPHSGMLQRAPSFGGWCCWCLCYCMPCCSDPDKLPSWIVLCDTDYY